MTKNQLKPKISKQHILGCNFYDEGCDGGFPLTVAKFASEFTLVEDKCYTNKCGKRDFTLTDDYSKSCCSKCESESNTYSVDSYSYVGGYYGGTSEFEIMREVLTRGPVAGVINAPNYLSKYRSGIFHSVTPLHESNVSRISQHTYRSLLQLPEGMTNHQTLREQDYEFEFVNHSIVILGWGFDEETQTKYWICANSWGKEWGENGFFRIIRGVNDLSIESVAEIIIPKISNYYESK